MPVTHHIDSIFSGKMGATGIDQAAYEAELAIVERSVEMVRDSFHSHSLAFLRLPEMVEDLAILKAAGDKFTKGAQHIVVLGTGGSSLGGQALAQLKDYNIPGLSGLTTVPRLHFFDNLDPDTLERFLDNVPLGNTRFIVVSKSGGTGETLVQTIAVLNALEAANLGDKIAHHVLGLSEPMGDKSNALRSLLEPLGVVFLEHNTSVGGRFSVLSNVGLLPAYLSGVDIEQVRKGAAIALHETLDAANPAQSPAACGAALNVAAMKAGKNITVMLGYADKLERFTAWWVQLWAESLGKNGQGSTPVRNIGPVDQHSQLQLHLAGPRDKLFTVITVGVRGTGPTIDESHAKKAGLDGFGGRTIGDLVCVQGQATIDTLAKNGCPVRHIHIDTMNEEALGYLVMHFMLETVITADLMGVDAYDQPAVEEGKVLAKRYLAQLS